MPQTSNKILFTVSAVFLLLMISLTVPYAQAEAGDLLLEINNPDPAVSDWFGSSVTGTTNGNILVGAYLDDTGAIDAGSVYLFDGNDGSLLLEINNPDPAVSDWFGASVTGTTNGNILVGASFDDADGTDAGIAYLFDGAERGTTNTPLLTIHNPTPNLYDYFGDSVAVTNDGNILVGVSFDDVDGTDAGVAYLFEGISTPPVGWVINEGIIYYEAGNVGIGTTSPAQKLDVNGNIKLTGSIISDGDICIGNC